MPFNPRWALGGVMISRAGASRNADPESGGDSRSGNEYTSGRAAGLLPNPAFYTAENLIAENASSVH